MKHISSALRNSVAILKMKGINQKVMFNKSIKHQIFQK